MRIISGDARGRRLYAPQGLQTRPTSDRVREALFNIIRARVEGACVLDVFGGSGALALEAMSRGADAAVIIDKSAEAVRVIRRNAGLVGVEARVSVIQSDWKAALPRLRGPFTLVFIDPPYAMTEAYGGVTERLVSLGLLEDGALVVMEHDAAFAPEGIPGALSVEDRRVYRDTALTLCVFRGGAAEEGGV